jgi:Family of unknown function (DUF5681)
MTTQKNGGRFKPGQSGNPAGRKPGQRHRTTVMAEKLMAGDVRAIVTAVLTAAKAGDMTAARMVLDRLVPPAKDRPLSLGLPDTSTAGGIDRAQDAIVAAVASGHLLPGEGVALSALVESRRRSLETSEFEVRLIALEARKSQ